MEDDNPAWMAHEPANQAKMTPADIEKERQAFREQHNKAKQTLPDKVCYEQGI